MAFSIRHISLLFFFLLLSSLSSLSILYCSHYFAYDCKELSFNLHILLRYCSASALDIISLTKRLEFRNES